MSHHSIKDVLILESKTANGSVSVFYFVFPWDTNPQSGTICFARRAIYDNDNSKLLGCTDEWVQPYGNPFLGTRARYVDLADACANVIKSKLAFYNAQK